jgi:hypothetical protein
MSKVLEELSLSIAENTTFYCKAQIKVGEIIIKEARTALEGTEEAQ